MHHLRNHLKNRLRNFVQLRKNRSRRICTSYSRPCFGSYLLWGVGSALSIFLGMVAGGAVLTGWLQAVLNQQHVRIEKAFDRIDNFQRTAAIQRQTDKEELSVKLKDFEEKSEAHLNAALARFDERTAELKKQTEKLSEYVHAIDKRVFRLEVYTECPQTRGR